MSGSSRTVALLTPWSWPLALKIPFIVAALMVVISAVITQGVLAKLSDTQQRHLEQLTGAYLDGLSTSILPQVLREDVWEVYDALDRSSRLYRGLDVAWTTVSNDAGQTIASNRPDLFPLQSELPEELRAAMPADDAVKLDSERGFALAMRSLVYQEKPIGRIYAKVDIAALLKERSDVFATLIVTNSVLTLLLASLGYMTVRRMLHPVSVLSHLLDRSAKGTVSAVPASQIGRGDSEFGRLFRRYNSLVEAVNEREMLASRLAEEERLASLGRLASGLAHEINNPLGGMFNALDAMKRHGDRASVRETSLRLLEQGLVGIRDLVRTTLMTYRADRGGPQLTAVEIDDLRLLIRSEIKRKAIDLVWANELPEMVALHSRPIRDALLNLLLNACAATPAGGRVSFRAWKDSAGAHFRVGDSGSGIPPEVRSYLQRPDAGRAPLDQQSGLGLWMVKRLMQEAGGRVLVACPEDAGTVIELVITLPDAELHHAA